MNRSILAVLLLSALTLGCTAAQVAQPVANVKLEGTLWKLQQLGETTVASPPGARQLNLVFAAPQDGVRRVSGFGGCNNLMGGYTLDGERIAFSRVASTMMACANGMELERQILGMLEKAARWSIRGNQLELFDSTGERIALFEAR